MLHKESNAKMYIAALAVGNLVVGAGAAMGTGLAQGSTGTSEPLRRGPNAVPWVDCSMGTSELIGEGPSVVIRLDARQ